VHACSFFADVHATPNCRTAGQFDICDVQLNIRCFDGH
jgi:hypothetical protein